MDQEETKGDPYTMEFIKKKGGPAAVSKKSGLNRQTVRQIAIGRNAPSFEFIKVIYSTYPDYDWRVGIDHFASITDAQPRYIEGQPTYTAYVEVAESEPQPKPEPQPAPLASSSVTDVLIEEMKERIKSLERQNTALLAIVSSYTGPHRHG